MNTFYQNFVLYFDPISDICVMIKWESVFWQMQGANFNNLAEGIYSLRCYKSKDEIEGFAIAMNPLGMSAMNLKHLAVKKVPA